MPDTEEKPQVSAEPKIERRGRKKKVLPPDTRPRMKMDPDVLKESALAGLEAGEDYKDVAVRLHLNRRTTLRWSQNLEAARISLERGIASSGRMTVGETGRPPRAGLALKPPRSKEELALQREVDGQTLKHAVFRIIQGDDYKKVSIALKAKGLNKLSALHYSVICNLPDVMRSRDAITMIALERGLGNKTKRINELSSIALQVSKRIKEELDKPSLDDRAVKILLTEYREYSKEIGIETGERVENINIDALIRQMSPQQLLSLAEVNEGDIIDTSFGVDEDEDAPDDAGEGENDGAEQDTDAEQKGKPDDDAAKND